MNVRTMFGYQGCTPYTIMFFPRSRYDEGDTYWEQPVFEAITKYRTFTWTDPAIQPVLDAEFDDGFGGPECINLVAWGDGWVYINAQYDGSDHLARIPGSADVAKDWEFQHP